MAQLNRLFQSYWEKLPKPIRNKFAIVTIVFVFWMAFIDRNSLLSQYYLQSTIRELKAKKTYFLDEIRRADADKQELFTSDVTMEKFARERYLMKRNDEDLFIIVPKESGSE